MLNATPVRINEEQRCSFELEKWTLLSLFSIHPVCMGDLDTLQILMFPIDKSLVSVGATGLWK